jgi:hypothetical protein
MIQLQHGGVPAGGCQNAEGRCAQEFKPGEIVPQSGVYRIIHDPVHADMPHEVTVIKGRRFTTCRVVRVCTDPPGRPPTRYGVSALRLARDRGFLDSLLEGDGFESWVPWSPPGSSWPQSMRIVQRNGKS